MGVESSPFVVAGPARPNDVIGRHETLATLHERAARGRFVLLIAPRRYGKTTLVHRLRHDAEQTRDLDVVIVDLLGVQTLEDVAIRLAQAWTRLPPGPLARAAATILPYVGGLDLLDTPRAVARRTGKRVLVVLDEFQAIASVKRAGAVIGSHIQHHVDQVSYLLSGSQRSSCPEAEQVPLGPFDPRDLGDYVVARLAAAGRDISLEALTGYLAFVEGHPQRSMLVADCLWATAAPGETIERPHLSAAIDEAVERCDAELRGISSVLSDAQARLIRLLAWAEPPTGAAAKRLELTQGSARAAAAKLSELGLVHRDGRLYRLTDPLLGEWTRRITGAP